MAKLWASVLLLLHLISGNGYVSGANCDWQNIGKLGASLILDSIPGIGSAMNKLFSIWPDDCAFDGIKTFINARLNEERQKRMKHKFEGFKSALEIAQRFNWTSNYGDMKAFYLDLEASKNLFMKENQEDAVIYFREYANLKIQVINFLIELNEDNNYTELLRNATTEIVNNAEKIIIDLAPKLMKMTGQYHYMQNKKKLVITTYRKKVRDLFGDSLIAWKDLCNCGFEEKNSIRSWNWIALKTDNNLWASCWVSGSYCRPRGCPGEDGPWPWQTSNNCRGEVFNIVSQSGNGYIKAGDVVGLRYSYQGGKGYWMSHYSDWVDTKTCPGEKFVGIQDPNNGCVSEKWIITAYGREHGEKIMHRDEVAIKAYGRQKHQNQLLTVYKWHGLHSYLCVNYNDRDHLVYTWTIYSSRATY